MFEIRDADYKDVIRIREIMEEAYNTLEDKSFYHIEYTDVECLERHIEKEGFTLVVENDKKEIVAFLVVRYPKQDNLGTYISNDFNDFKSVVHMETVAVHPNFRGFGLQSKLIKSAEEKLSKNIKYSMCTVHPENKASLRNFEKNGYKIIAQSKHKHADLVRVVLLKKLF